MLLVVLIVKKLLERFIKKNCKRQIKRSLELKNKSNETGINYMSNGRATIILGGGGGEGREEWM